MSRPHFALLWVVSGAAMASCISAGEIGDGNDARASGGSEMGGQPEMGGDQQKAEGGEMSSGGEPSGGAPSGGAPSGGESSGGTDMGGQSSTGGTTPQLGGLGDSCAIDDDCALSHCADGVCCESACDGVCQKCSAEGTCTETPADDADCGIISCSLGNNECLTYDSAITSGRCASFGVCKTKSDCGTQDVHDGTTCSLAEASNSVCRAGVCSLPQVQCGGVPCNIDQNLDRVCCERLSSGDSCTSSEFCFLTNYNDPNRTTRIMCDEHRDCRSGELCAITFFGETEISCETEPNYQGQISSKEEVCMSPVMAEVPCSNGGTCRAFEFFPGWKFCDAP